MQWRHLPLAISLTLLAACSQRGATPEQQALFCKAVDESLAKYQEIAEKPAYIDQQADLKRIFDSRTKLFTDILGDGRIEAWRGNVKRMLVSDRGVYLTVALPCGVDLTPSDAQLIKNDSPIYQQLRKLEEGGKVTISGNLERQPTATAPLAAYKFGYRENSITDGGAMRNPEFVFTTSKVEP